jgi:hypothetical protein
VKIPICPYIKKNKNKKSLAAIHEFPFSWPETTT